MSADTPRPVESRRRGREAALQLLYQCEVGHLSLPEARGMFWSMDDEDAVTAERTRAFAEHLAGGTLGALDRIDPLIEAHSANWRLVRMAIVDRLVLRLAVYEMLEERETDRAVVINEALVLAKRFSTPDAAKFVNGVLDAVRRHLDEDTTKTP